MKARSPSPATLHCFVLLCSRFFEPHFYFLIFHSFEKCYLLTHLFLACGYRHSPCKIVTLVNGHLKFTTSMERKTARLRDPSPARQKSVAAAPRSSRSLSSPPKHTAMSVLRHGARRLADASSRRGQVRRPCAQPPALRGPDQSTHGGFSIPAPARLRDPVF